MPTTFTKELHDDFIESCATGNLNKANDVLSKIAEKDRGPLFAVFINNYPSGEEFHDTPLHLAASNGHANIVELLLNKGMHLNLEIPSTKETPLLEAFIYNQHNVVDLLLSRCENDLAEETKIKGRSLIKFTLEENRDPDMIRALLIDGFNRYSKHEDPKKLKWLTELFSCEEFKEKRHGFLLELASKDSHPIFSIVPSLLSEEDVSMTRINDGTTLLHQATKHCAVQNVESLLKLGANPKKDDVLGNTPYSIIQNKISSLHTPKKDKGGCKEILTLMERKMGVDNRDRSRSEHPGRSPSPDTVDPVNSSEYKGGYR